MKEGVNRVMAVGFGVLLGVVLAVIAVLGWMERMGETGGAVQPTKSLASLRGGVSKGTGDGEVVSEERLEEMMLEMAKMRGRWLAEFGAQHAYSVKTFEWERSSREWVENLSVEEVRCLLNSLQGGDSSFESPVWGFIEALFWSWGKSEPMEALNLVKNWPMREIENDGGSSGTEPMEMEYQPEVEEFKEWMLSSYEHDFFEQIMIGWAAVNSEAAWSFFRSSLEESGWVRFSKSDHVAEIVESATNRDSELAWQLVVGEEDLELRSEMVRGFVEGLGGEQNWKLVSERIAKQFNDDLDVQLRIAGRWFLEDPHEAMSWYENELQSLLLAARKTEQEKSLLEFRERIFERVVWESGLKGQEVFQNWWNEDSPNEEVWKEEILAKILFRDEAQGDPFVTTFPLALEELIGIRGVEQRVERSEYWSANEEGSDFVSLLTALPEEAARRQFLAYVKYLEPRVKNQHPFFSEMSLDKPNYSLEAARAVVDEIPLSAEERVLVTEVFERIEAEDERSRRE